MIDVLRDERQVYAPLCQVRLQLRERIMRGIRRDLLHFGAAMIVELMHQQRIAREALRSRHVAIIVFRPDAARIAECR